MVGQISMVDLQFAGTASELRQTFDQPQPGQPLALPARDADQKAEAGKVRTCQLASGLVAGTEPTVGAFLQETKIITVFSKDLSSCSFKTSPETVCLPLMFYIRLPLLLCNVEDLLHKRDIEI